jgi:hypothetical protein
MQDFLERSLNGAGTFQIVEEEKKRVLQVESQALFLWPYYCE